MFTKACAYAIKSMIFIAANCSESKKINLNEIAFAIDSPGAFTAKILQQLKRSGLLNSSIGAKGGFQIEKNKTITIGNIVNAIDGDSYLTSCVLGLKTCSPATPCPAHSTYTRIREILIKDLLNLNINEFSDLIKKQSISLK